MAHPQIDVQRITKWLTEEAFPLWMTTGFDQQNGCFVESLSRHSIPETTHRRAIVQMRQVYSLCEGHRLQRLSKAHILPLVEKTMDYVIKHYARPSGAFIHAVDLNGKASNLQEDLYTQAFVLFGLAHAFELTGKDEYKQRAYQLITFLNTSRRHQLLGYTEIINGQISFQSNPHMHLFESALAWMRTDSNPVWKNLAIELFELCKTKFIDHQTQILAEHFDENWAPVLHNGQFVFEPGHQFEWAWLLLEFQKLSGMSLNHLALKLFQNGQNYGINKNTNFVYDEVWSDFRPKKLSSRLWPHCEWIKAALAIAPLIDDPNERKHCVHQAELGVSTLFKYFHDLKPGLWEDLHTEEGSFSPQSVKASSFYHIVNALSEYIQKRPQFDF